VAVRERGIMINLTTSVLVYRPIKQVFDFISTAENDFQWKYGTLASAQVSEGAVGVGAFFRTIGHLMGRRVHETFEITEYEANRKYGFKSLSGPLQSQTLYTFEVAGGSTKISVSTQANVINFFQIRESILEKQLKKQLKENLAMLKGILETP
jgi:polyketide cyclase/dehydrase/lipid transport protein